MSTRALRQKKREVALPAPPVVATRNRSPSIEFVRMIKTAGAPFNTPSDLILLSAQDTRFHVNMSILALASPYFCRLQATLLARVALDAKATHRIPESDATLETILRFVYPVPDPILYDLDDVTAAFVAARTYELPVVEDALRKMFIQPRFVDDEPIRVYAIACRFGLTEEANIAALRSCKSSLKCPSYEEFEYITGTKYHELVQFHRDRATAAISLIEKTSKRRPGIYCACGATWWTTWSAAAIDALRNAPASDEVFSNAFIGRNMPPRACGDCATNLLSALQPGGTLTMLKAQIDALPSQLPKNV